jgi:hypothetical protein
MSSTMRFDEWQEPDGTPVLRSVSGVLEVWDGSGYIPSALAVRTHYLVIGGGGGGGCGLNAANREGGGGGGAGGYRTSFGTSGQNSGAEFAVLLKDSPYTITVGAGGAGSTTENTPGVQGNNSIFHSILSFGGGRGRESLTAGDSGGSGGGGGATNVSGGTTAGGAGFVFQGFSGGLGAFSASSGGGGGAGAAGGNAVASTRAGAGGAGLASTITGISVTRAGGGGGGHYFDNEDNVGGSGGGGAGGSFLGSRNGVSGLVNTGSGGGGASRAGFPNGGSGGSGVVIIRVAGSTTATFSAGVTFTLTNVGSDKVYTVTATSTTSETVTFS